MSLDNSISASTTHSLPASWHAGLLGCCGAVRPDKEDSSILFFSIGKCVEHLRSKGLPATQTTLVKYIGTGKSYHGYIFKYV